MENHYKILSIILTLVTVYYLKASLNRVRKR